MNRDDESVARIGNKAAGMAAWWMGVLAGASVVFTLFLIGSAFLADSWSLGLVRWFIAIVMVLLSISFVGASLRRFDVNVRLWYDSGDEEGKGGLRR